MYVISLTHSWLGLVGIFYYKRLLRRFTQDHVLITLIVCLL